MMPKPQHPLIVWVYYGSEGWHPRGFDTVEQLREWILTPPGGHDEFVITRLLDVKITLEERTVS
jgi:hypothetical protein